MNTLAPSAVKTPQLGLSAALDATNGVKSQTNAGSAGGTIYYINLGGIKWAWGTTASLSGNTNRTITLPTSFFATIQSATINAMGPYSNTNVMTANFTSNILADPTLLDFTPIIIQGVNPVNGYSWFVIGT